MVQLIEYAFYDGVPSRVNFTSWITDSMVHAAQQNWTHASSIVRFILLLDLLLHRWSPALSECFIASRAHCLRIQTALEVASSRLRHVLEKPSVAAVRGTVSLQQTEVLAGSMSLSTAPSATTMASRRVGAQLHGVGHQMHMAVAAALLLLNLISMVGSVLQASMSIDTSPAPSSRSALGVGRDCISQPYPALDHNTKLGADAPDIGKWSRPDVTAFEHDDDAEADRAHLSWLDVSQNIDADVCVNLDAQRMDEDGVPVSQMHVGAGLNNARTARDIADLTPSTKSRISPRTAPMLQPPHSIHAQTWPTLFPRLLTFLTKLCTTHGDPKEADESNGQSMVRFIPTLRLNLSFQNRDPPQLECDPTGIHLGDGSPFDVEQFIVETTRLDPSESGGSEISQQSFARYMRHVAQYPHASLPMLLGWCIHGGGDSDLNESISIDLVCSLVRGYFCAVQRDEADDGGVNSPSASVVSSILLSFLQSFRPHSFKLLRRTLRLFATLSSTGLFPFATFLQSVIHTGVIEGGNGSEGSSQEHVKKNHESADERKLDLNKWSDLAKFYLTHLPLPPPLSPPSSSAESRASGHAVILDAASSVSSESEIPILPSIAFNKLRASVAQSDLSRSRFLALGTSEMDTFRAMDLAFFDLLAWWEMEHGSQGDARTDATSPRILHEARALLRHKQKHNSLWTVHDRAVHARQWCARNGLDMSGLNGLDSLSEWSFPTWHDTPPAVRSIPSQNPPSHVPSSYIPPHPCTALSIFQPLPFHITQSLLQHLFNLLQFQLEGVDPSTRLKLLCSTEFVPFCSWSLSLLEALDFTVQTQRMMMWMGGQLLTLRQELQQQQPSTARAVAAVAASYAHLESLLLSTIRRDFRATRAMGLGEQMQDMLLGVLRINPSTSVALLELDAWMLSHALTLTLRVRIEKLDRAGKWGEQNDGKVESAESEDAMMESSILPTQPPSALSKWRALLRKALEDRCTCSSSDRLATASASSAPYHPSTASPMYSLEELVQFMPSPDDMDRAQVEAFNSGNDGISVSVKAFVNEMVRMWMKVGIDACAVNGWNNTGQCTSANHANVARLIHRSSSTLQRVWTHAMLSLRCCDAKVHSAAFNNGTQHGMEDDRHRASSSVPKAQELFLTSILDMWFRLCLGLSPTNVDIGQSGSDSLHVETRVGAATQELLTEFEMSLPQPISVASTYLPSFSRGSPPSPVIDLSSHLLSCITLLLHEWLSHGLFHGVRSGGDGSRDGPDGGGSGGGGAVGFVLHRVEGALSTFQSEEQPRVVAVLICMLLGADILTSSSTPLLSLCPSEQHVRMQRSIREEADVDAETVLLALRILARDAPSSASSIGALRSALICSSAQACFLRHPSDFILHVLPLLQEADDQVQSRSATEASLTKQVILHLLEVTCDQPAALCTLLRQAMHTDTSSSDQGDASLGVKMEGTSGRDNGARPSTNSISTNMLIHRALESLNPWTMDASFVTLLLVLLLHDAGHNSNNQDGVVLELGRDINSESLTVLFRALVRMSLGEPNELAQSKASTPSIPSIWQRGSALEIIRRMLLASRLPSSTWLSVDQDVWDEIWKEVQGHFVAQTIRFKLSSEDSVVEEGNPTSATSVKNELSSDGVASGSSSLLHTLESVSYADFAPTSDAMPDAETRTRSHISPVPTVLTLLFTAPSISTHAHLSTSHVSASATEHGSVKSLPLSPKRVPLPLMVQFAEQCILYVSIALQHPLHLWSSSFRRTFQTGILDRVTCMRPCLSSLISNHSMEYEQLLKSILMALMLLHDDDDVNAGSNGEAGSSSPFLLRLLQRFRNLMDEVHALAHPAGDASTISTRSTSTTSSGSGQKDQMLFEVQSLFHAATRSLRLSAARRNLIARSFNIGHGALEDDVSWVSASLPPISQATTHSTSSHLSTSSSAHSHGQINDPWLLLEGLSNTPFIDALLDHSKPKPPVGTALQTSGAAHTRASPEPTPTPTPTPPSPDYSQHVHDDAHDYSMNHDADHGAAGGGMNMNWL